MRTSIEKVITERVERTEVSPALGPSAGPYRGRPRAFRDRRRARRAHAQLGGGEPADDHGGAGQAGARLDAPVRRHDRDRPGAHSSWSRFAAAVRDDPDHPVRQAIDRMLTQLAEDLRTTRTPGRGWSGEDRALPHPDVQASVSRIWETAQRSCSKRPTIPPASCGFGVRRAGAAGQALATDAGDAGEPGRLGHRHRGGLGPRLQVTARPASSPTRCSAGTAAGRRADRARRRPGPAVHPHQRHRGGGAGRDRDPRPDPAADLNIARHPRNRSACCG